MPFMKKEIYQGSYFEIETTVGTEIIPSYSVASHPCLHSTLTPMSAFLYYLKGTPLDDHKIIESQQGWLARLDAPGYLDCTDWTAHKTQKEANDYLNEAYDAAPKYQYYINLDERGEFYADVRNDEEKTVFDIHGFEIFEDGFMKNKNDIDGLETHLKELGVIEQDAELTKGN